MHEAAFRYVRGEVQTVTLPPGLVIEIGSRMVNGSVRGLFDGRPYIGVDHAGGLGVDVVCSGASYQPPELAAVVVSTETLEHTEDAEAICRNAAQMLQPGGVFILTAAGYGRVPHSAVDGGPLPVGEYYRNITPDDLQHWLSDFSEVRIQVNPVAADIYATAIKAAA